MIPSTDHLRDVARRALAEDLGEIGDVTARVGVPEGLRGVSEIVAKQSGILAGTEVARECFLHLDDRVTFSAQRVDGDELNFGDVILTVHGEAAALLAAERTALNFMQRLSGIATRTRQFVDAVAGLDVRIMDTRKTTPMLRALEKHAVTVGGGVNHRFGLFDQVLLKENHFALAGRPYGEVVRAAVSLADPDRPVIAEARNLDEGLIAVAAGAGVVLLDNFGPGPALREAVDCIRSRARESGATVEIEASGGVTLDTVRAFAECGVDRISIGALTHSSGALDLSMLTKTAP